MKRDHSRMETERPRLLSSLRDLKMRVWECLPVPSTKVLGYFSPSLRDEEKKKTPGQAPAKKSAGKPAHSKAGFTLIEIAVVMIIVGIIAAMVLPRMGMMTGVQLKSAAREVTGTIRITYAAAVMERKPYRIAFDLNAQTYWVEERAGDEYVKPAADLLGTHVLPDNIYLKGIQIADRPFVDREVEFLYFTPGGYAEEAAIYLGVVDDDPVVSVFTHPFTGRATIVLGEMTRADWVREEEGY
jgi:general secretion pathway protein H